MLAVEPLSGCAIPVRPLMIPASLIRFSFLLFLSPLPAVPNKVDQLFRAQDFHARKQREARSWMTREERLAAPFVDYYRPIIADGDTGHGGLTAVMRLTKLFIEAGAAGMHLEDRLLHDEM